MELFLDLHGYEITASESDIAWITVAISQENHAARPSRHFVSNWLRGNIEAAGDCD